MNKHILRMAGVMMSIMCSAWIASAQPAATPPQTAASAPFVLGPPQEDGGPVVVRASFEILEISAINDDKETFEFTGIMTLKWRDRRQAFDPAAAGVKEKIYQGDYQFNEISPSWYPQLVLVNSAGSYDSQGVVLRAEPDGTQTLIEKISAVAKTDLNLRRFPFDSQTLTAVFQVLGFDRSEVTLQVDQTGSAIRSGLSIPQWFIRGVSISSQDRPTFIAGKPSVTSGFVTAVDARRASFYISHLVILPLVVIVLLSFSVFWIEPSSTSDRMNISFIGILTAVAYQLVMNDTLPRIAYVTWMNACLSLSFLMMVGTVIVHLTVGNLDRKGNAALALRIDRYCRWVFPLAYVGLLVGAFLVTFFIL